MTDTTRKIPQAIDPQMVTMLLRKRDALLEERTDIRAQRAKLAQRDREIDRDLADCQAAGRVFGVAVELPKDEPDGDDNFLRHIRNAQFKIGSADWMPAPLRLQTTAKSITSGAKAVATKAEMPRVSDIVLDRLKEAAAKGSKAAPIQAYIENTYGTKIYDKTVGMTLYRLQKDGFVIRRGHTWFIADKAVNPGAVTPGPDNRAT